MILFRGGNRTGRVGFRFGSGQFDLLEEIGSGQGRVGPGQFICCIFFISLIDFYWIEGHLISDQVGSGQFDFLKKSDRIGFGSGRVSRVGSDSATSNFIYCSTLLNTKNNRICNSAYKFTYTVCGMRCSSAHILKFIF
jgi:hypothetical protein